MKKGLFKKTMAIVLSYVIGTVTIAATTSLQSNASNVTEHQSNVVETFDEYSHANVESQTTTVTTLHTKQPIETTSTNVTTIDIAPPYGYTTTTTPGSALRCSTNEVDLKAGEREGVGLYFGNGQPFGGALAEFDVDDPSIALVQTSDVPYEFYVIGISEGRTGMTIIDPINKYRTRLYVNVTGETPEDFGSGMRITVDSMPSKLEYNVGINEELDFTGGVFSIEYENADNDTITAVDKLSMTDPKSDAYINTSAFNSLLPGTYPIFISFNHKIYNCWDVYVFYVTVSNKPAPVKGDINGNGTIDIDDATTVLSIYANACAGIDVQNEVDSIADTDVNGDGITDIADATCILTYYAHNMAGITCTWEDVIN